MSEAHTPIIGGVPSTAADYPATGVLLKIQSLQGQRRAGYFCTGTLVAPDVVVTAGHCLAPDPQEPAGVVTEYYFSLSLDVTSFGQSTLTLPPETTRGVGLIVHPQFNIENAPPVGFFSTNDVALLFLSAPVTRVTPAVILDDQDATKLVRNAPLAITGYGARTTAGVGGGIKYQTDTTILQVGTSEFQIGAVRKCHGDSGGPSYIDIADGRLPMRRLAGLTSRAYDTSQDCEGTGIDTRTDAHRAWIDGAMRAACNQGVRLASSCTVQAGLPVPLPPTEPRDGGTLDSGQGEPQDGGRVDGGSTGPVRERDAGTPPRKPDAGGGATLDDDTNDAGAISLRGRDAGGASGPAGSVNGYSASALTGSCQCTDTSPIARGLTDLVSVMLLLLVLSLRRAGPSRRR